MPRRPGEPLPCKSWAKPRACRRARPSAPSESRFSAEGTAPAHPGNGVPAAQAHARLEEPQRSFLAISPWI